jgi:hypothetical protein
MIHLRNVVRTSLIWGPALLLAPLVASAQVTPDLSQFQLNLQVRPVDQVSTCQAGSFRAEFRITNFTNVAFDLSRASVRLNFNNATLVEPVNNTFVTVFSPAGGLTGQSTTATVRQEQGPMCAVAPDRTTNQTMFIDLGAAQLPPNGGFATFIATLRRDGGQFPFDVGCDDFTKLVNPDRTFRNDRFFGLVQPSGIIPTGRLFCEFTAPNVVDPETGINPCTGTTGCPLQ